MRPQRPSQSWILLTALLVSAGCGLEEAARGSQSTVDQASSVRPGLDVLLTDSIHRVRDRRVGLITNQTGIDQNGTHGIDRLVAAPDVELVALFSPEHGIRGEVRGGQNIETEVEQRTGLPVYSLYGDTRKPTPEMLRGLDVLIFDIQDVGARYYTYVSTMALAMEAAGEAGIPFLVLDRPNPIGGVAVQGNVLDPDFSSFVGLYPIPMRHGMTPGELALLFAGEFGVGVDVGVIPVDAWTRDHLFWDLGLPWIPPSPNMPSVESALHYPGTCLFEGTPISVGRGTDLAFQIVGAPWLDGDSLASALGGYALPGVEIGPWSFTPVDPGDGKFSGLQTHGVRLTGTGPEYDPILTALALLKETRSMSGDRWVWREAHFDRLAGTDRLRLGLEAGESVEQLRAGWDEALDAFRRLREPYLLYLNGSR